MKLLKLNFHIKFGNKGFEYIKHTYLKEKLGLNRSLYLIM